MDTDKKILDSLNEPRSVQSRLRWLSFWLLVGAMFWFCVWQVFS
jgi:hypothetical protein